MAFKVGDKVIRNGASFCGVLKGFTYEISEVVDDSKILIKEFEHLGYWLLRYGNTKYWELVEPAPVVVEHKFKVGDKVEIKTNTVNRETIVLAVDADGWVKLKRAYWGSDTWVEEDKTSWYDPGKFTLVLPEVEVKTWIVYHPKGGHAGIVTQTVFMNEDLATQFVESNRRNGRTIYATKVITTKIKI